PDLASRRDTEQIAYPLSPKPRDIPRRIPPPIIGRGGCLAVAKKERRPRTTRNKPRCTMDMKGAFRVDCPNANVAVLLNHHRIAEVGARNEFGNLSDCPTGRFQ